MRPQRGSVGYLYAVIKKESTGQYIAIEQMKKMTELQNSASFAKALLT